MKMKKQTQKHKRTGTAIDRACVIFVWIVCRKAVWRVVFRRGKSGEVKNIDLWERLLADMKPHQVRFNWIKGHAGHEFNERCDRLAVAAYKRLESE